MEYIPVRVSDLIRKVNRDIFLPAIQREFVWGTDRVERLFDSIMADFPIGSFLYWNLDQKNKDEWPVYEFIRDFDGEWPHNTPANMAGITKDITLVLDGQQRITSLYVGLKGSYRYFYYRWRKTHLYLNLLKPPTPNDENPEELTYGFAFREDDQPWGDGPQLWYPVGRILDFEDAEDAKADMRPKLAGLSEDQRDNANKLIGRLHSRIHTTLVGNYYQEKSQDYDKVLQVFVRANSAGQPLEYSDLLLATATAKWETLDARSEIHEFTDSLNEIGTGYGFGKDFVLKASLYLTESLPIQYKVKNFSKSNLRKIEANWEKIKESLATTVRLISRFGFNSKNVVAPLALLPIALFLLKRGDKAFDTSSKSEDAEAQVAIRRWFVFSTLKNAFGGSSDTTLARLRELLTACGPHSPFPATELYKSLGIEPRLNEAEIERILAYGYQGRYTNLVLSLLYPDRDWKDAVFHEDHIFPQSEFQVRALKRRRYDEAKIDSYLSRYNTICNLQLLTDSENLSKNATPFDDWLRTRDAAFRKRHLIPNLPDYGFDHFKKFADARTGLIVAALKALNEGWQSSAESPPDETPGDTDDDGGDDKAGGESGSGKQGGGDTEYDREIRRLKEEAMSKQNPVEVMRLYLSAPANEDGLTPVRRSEEVDKQRVALIDGTLRQMLIDYLAGRVPLEDFKPKNDGINKEHKCWGFQGIKGQMFFNLVVKLASDAAECDREIKAAIAVPPSEEAARTRINAFANYVRRIGEAHVKAGGNKQGRPKPSSIPFFLSYFWQLQDRRTWPIYYTNAVNTLGALGLWQPGDDLAENYIAYKHQYEELAQKFSQVSGKEFDLYGVEHVFWFIGEHPFEV
jgi:hypothetical protein